MPENGRAHFQELEEFMDSQILFEFVVYWFIIV